MTQPDWSSETVKTTAAEIRRHRNRLGLSAQQLADRCAQLGLPIQRSVLANLENGRRPLMSIAELLVIAKALEVPPILLVFPAGQGEEIEILPGVKAPAWDALKWFAGEEPFPRWPDRDDEGGEWEQGAEPIRLHRSHEHHLREWRIARHEAAAARRRSDEETAAIAERAARTHEDTLWEMRRQMRRAGLVPPDLPDELSHIDTDQSPLGRAFEAHYAQRTEEE